MLSKITRFVHPIKYLLCKFNEVRKNKGDMIIFIAVVLISLLSFAVGYITAKNQGKELIRFEMTNDQ